MEDSDIITVTEEGKELGIVAIISLFCFGIYYLLPNGLTNGLFIGCLIYLFLQTYNLYKNHYFESTKDMRLVQFLIGTQVVIILGLAIYYWI